MPRPRRRSASWTRRSSAPRSASSSSSAAYYQFQDPLDVDRYEIDGVSQDTVVSVRELNMDQLGAAASWQNTTLVYTHGYGVVAAEGNDRTADGDPVFLERGIPAAGFLSDREDFEPRVYFGEFSPTYSIVGAPEGTDPVELDYPTGADGASETKTTFSGDGGPEHRQRLQPPDLRAQVPVRADPLLRQRQRGLSDPLRPRPEPARAEGRAVPRRSTATRTRASWTAASSGSSTATP